MSGHSKWSTIRHKKGAADAKRGKIFTKIIKEIMVAARMGGGDPNANPRLRAAVLAAKAENMPKDNIDRAIKKGAGEMDGVNYEEFNYEGYGPSGVAVLLEIMTDNRNRAASEIRHIFSRNGGNMGEAGCVAWMFDKKGVLVFPKAGNTEDELLELGLEAGAEDVRDEGEAFEVHTAPEDFAAVQKAFEDAGKKMESAELAMVPKNLVPVDADVARKVMNLIDALEDNDDVQNVYVNADFPDDFVAD